MTNLQQILKTAQGAIKANSPVILTSVSAAGVVATALTSARSAIRANNRLREAEDKLDLDEQGRPIFTHVPLEAKERFQLVWKEFIPPVAIAGVTVACVIGAHNVNARRQAALVAAYSLTENAFREYKEKVIEQIGENKERKVVDSIVEDKLKANPVSNSEIIITGNGKVLCYETLSGRYFESDMETLRKAQNDINALMHSDMYASLNEFYQRVGLPPTSMGEMTGWNVDHMLDLQYSPILSEDNRPCIGVGYNVMPVPEYYSFR